MRQIEDELLEMPQVGNTLQLFLFRVKVSRKMLSLKTAFKRTFWKYDKIMIYCSIFITYGNFPSHEAKNGEKNG